MSFVNEALFTAHGMDIFHFALKEKLVRPAESFKMRQARGNESYLLFTINI